MHVKGRLRDALNKREPIEISRRPVGAGRRLRALVEAPGLRTVDPYDLIVVLAGEGTLPPLSDTERTAHKVHKIAYDVALEVPPFRVIGTVYLYPGSEPDRLLDRATEMFVPVVDAVAYQGDRPLAESMDAVLVNRFYLRGVEQIDKRTGEKPLKLPGVARSAAPRGRTSTPLIEAVVFDVGETLVDETRLWAEWADWLGRPAADLLRGAGRGPSPAARIIGRRSGLFRAGRRPCATPSRSGRPTGDADRSPRRRTSTPTPCPALRAVGGGGLSRRHRRATSRARPRPCSRDAGRRRWRSSRRRRRWASRSPTRRSSRPWPIAWTCRRRPSPTSATGSTTTSVPPPRPGCGDLPAPRPVGLDPGRPRGSAGSGRRSSPGRAARGPGRPGA